MRHRLESTLNQPRTPNWSHGHARWPKWWDWTRELCPISGAESLDPSKLPTGFFQAMPLQERCSRGRLATADIEFGNWAGQLGDGRALSLGEVPASSSVDWTASGHRFTSAELQLKGLVPRRTAVTLTVAQCCARVFANTCAVRPCIF